MIEWFDIRDKLPEPKERVLIYSNRGIDIAYRMKNLDIFIVNDTIPSNKMNIIITNWAKLPKPPYNILNHVNGYSDPNCSYSLEGVTIENLIFDAKSDNANYVE